MLGVRGPFGTSWDVADGAGGDVVFVAGGIGLAPLRPAILEVIGARDRYGRVVLLYGSRTPEDILFGDELRAWAERPRRRRPDDRRQRPARVEGQGRPGHQPHAARRLRPAHDARPGVRPRGHDARRRRRRWSARGVPGDRIRLSMERSMKCGVGLCGHCQLRELFVCVDGPVLGYDRLAPLLTIREL